jgi:hypothetical protein
MGNSTEEADGDMTHDGMMESRSASGQAGYQLATLGVTLLISIVGGIITGLIMKLPFWNEPEDDELYDDKPFWDEVEYHDLPTADIPMRKFVKDGNTGEAPV